MKPIVFFLFIVFLPFSISAEPVRFTTQFRSSSMSWNPQYAFTTTEAQIFTALYEGLTTYHPATLRPQPGAAESWDISEDGMIITFHLRQNLKWSNGERLTSDDFKDSWLHLLEPDTAAEYASLLDDIIGVMEYRRGETSSKSIGIDTPDEQTLIIRLKQASPQILSILCHYSFVPIHKDFRNIEDWSALRSVPINGPFKIRARNSEEVIMDRNPHYWDQDNVAVDIQHMLFMDNSEEIMNRFNQFEIDWSTSGMDLSLLGIGEALSMSPLFSTTYYYFSNRNTPWKDERVRRALALLVPWKSIREDRFIPAETLVPPIPNYPVADVGFPEEDLRYDEAMKLLSEAGFPEGKSLPPLTIRIPQERPEVDIMKEAWSSQLNLEIIIEILPFPRYYDSIKEGGYDIATITWIGDYADPQSFLDMWETHSSLNESAFSNKEYDQILEQASHLPHLERLKKLTEAEDILLKSCQVLPIEHYPAINLIDRRFVKGWFPNALDIHPFKDIVPKMGFHIPGTVRR